MMRYPSVPLIQPGGYQPYDASSAQTPGLALDAMLAGRGVMGNPADIQRNLQATVGQPTLLSLLMGGGLASPADGRITPVGPGHRRANILRQVRSY